MHPPSSIARHMNLPAHVVGGIIAAEEAEVAALRAAEQMALDIANRQAEHAAERLRVDVPPRGPNRAERRAAARGRR